MRMHSGDHVSCEHLARPRHIIVATDLNDCDVLLPHAIAQAKVCGADLTLVHALTTDGVPALDVAVSEKLAFEVGETMHQVAANVKAQGIACSSMLAHTHFPEDYLPQAVRQVKAKRLIMASHGRGRLGQIILRSVAHDLLSTIDIPIFAVGPKNSIPTQHLTPKKILHPVSFSSRYQESVEFAQNLAELYHAELMLMHVLDSDLPDQLDPDRTVQWANSALEAAISDRTTVTGPVFTHVARGNTVEEILKAATAFGADWIVLGTRPSDDAPIFANSAAYKLMAAGPIPVLTLPHWVAPKAADVEKKEIVVVTG